MFDLITYIWYITKIAIVERGDKYAFARSEIISSIL